MTTDRTSHPAISSRKDSRKEWSVSYSQSDVETIREQIQQEQGARRRLLLLALFVTTAALVGAIILLSTSYGLYSRSLSQRQALDEENSRLKAQAADRNQELDDLKQKQAMNDQTRAEAHGRLQKILPAALAPSSGGREASTLAAMVYSLPAHQVEVERKPPEAIFRNWKVKAGDSTSTYALVGGFVDGKWIIYSDLIGRSTKEETVKRKGERVKHPPVQQPPASTADGTPKPSG